MNARRGGRATRLALLATVLAACGRVVVLDARTAREANEAQLALERAGIAVHREPSDDPSAPGTRVSVAPDDVSRAVAALTAESLPRHEPPGFDETYGTPPLVPSPDDARARRERAIAGELSRTLEAIDGVVAARIHITIAAASEQPLDATDPPRSTASVLLRVRGRAPISTPDVQQLVAHAVPNLRAEDVTVITLAVPVPTTSRAAAFAWVGPIAVAAGFATRLRIAFALSFLVNIAFAIVVLRRVWRTRRRG